MRLSERVCQLFGEVTREIDDAMHLLVTQELFRLCHRGAGIRQFDIRRCTPAMKKSPALRAVAEVHHGNRHIGDLLIPINTFVQERVR